MSAEAIARLRNARTAVRTGLVDGEPPETYAMVSPGDLRALLEAFDKALNELEDLEGMAKMAMVEANNDGAEWDIDAVLADARAVLKQAGRR